MDSLDRIKAENRDLAKCIAKTYEPHYCVHCNAQHSWSQFFGDCPSCGRDTNGQNRPVAQSDRTRQCTSL